MHMAVVHARLVYVVFFQVSLRFKHEVFEFCKTKFPRARILKLTTFRCIPHIVHGRDFGPLKSWPKWFLDVWVQM
jgi:hypothetical protein